MFVIAGFATIVKSSTDKTGLFDPALFHLNIISEPDGTLILIVAVNAVLFVASFPSIATAAPVFKAVKPNKGISVNVPVRLVIAVEETL